MYVRTDGWTDGRADGQTDRQTDGRTDAQTDVRPYVRTSVHPSVRPFVRSYINPSVCAGRVTLKLRFVKVHYTNVRTNLHLYECTYESTLIRMYV